MEITMRFKHFLVETHSVTLLEKHDLVLQKVIDALDNSHVDHDESKISFDVGIVSGTPKLRGLRVVIRPSSKNQIRLGRDSSGYAIVIDTTKDMPNRTDIDTFLSTKDVYDGFASAYKEFINTVFDGTKEYEQTETEQSLQINNRGGFESAYEDLIEAIMSRTQEYQSAVEEIDRQLNIIGNAGKKTVLTQAKENLKNEYFGKDVKEFVSKVMALPEAEFVKHLDKEWKGKLDGRLASWYGSNVSND